MKKRILCILLILALWAAQIPLAVSAVVGPFDDQNNPGDATPPQSQGSNDPKNDPDYDNGIRNVQGLNGLQASQHGTRLDFFEKNVRKILETLKNGEDVTISMPEGSTIDAFALYWNGTEDLSALKSATGSITFRFPDGSTITVSARDLIDAMSGMEAGDKLAFSSTQPYVYVLKPDNTRGTVELGQRTPADDGDVMSSPISIGPGGNSNGPLTVPQAAPGEEVTVRADVTNEVEVPVGMEIVNITENAQAVFVSGGRENNSMVLDPGGSVEIQVTFTPDVDEDYGLFPVSVEVQCRAGDSTALKRNEYFNFNFQVVPVGRSPATPVQ